MHTEEGDLSLDYSGFDPRAVTEINDSLFPSHFEKQRKSGRSISNYLGRVKPTSHAVPSLDLSGLNHIAKDYKHWYQYSKKLEDAVKLLNEKIKVLEDENVDLKYKTLNNNDNTCINN